MKNPEIASEHKTVEVITTNNNVLLINRPILFCFNDLHSKSATEGLV